jgi:hypothetical protein
MVDFTELFAAHLAPELTQRAASLESQTDVDSLFAGATLRLRGGCDDEFGHPA